MAMIGKVLWWDCKDGNGIIIDPAGNEFYFDTSVIDRTQKLPKRGQFLSFEINSQVRGTLCAFKVRLPNANKRESIKREFHRQAAEAAL